MALTKVSFSMIDGAVVNALDYGADDSGSSDSSAAIQSALSYATANNQALYLPSGTYLVNTAIVLTQPAFPVVIFGAGKTTVIKTTATVNGVITVQGTDPDVDVSRFFQGVFISNLRLNGPERYGGSRAGTGIYTYGCQGVHLDQVFVYGFDNGVRLRNTDLANVTRCQFQVNNVGLTTTTNTGYALGGQANSFLILGCWINNNGTYGIEYVGGNKLTIDANNFSSNGTSINVCNTTEAGAVTQSPTITNNYFESDSLNCIQLGGGAGVTKGGIVTGNSFLAATNTTVIACLNVDVNAGTGGPLQIFGNTMFPVDGVGPFTEINQSTTSAALRANYNNNKEVLRANANGPTPVATYDFESSNKANGEDVTLLSNYGLNSADAKVPYVQEITTIITNTSGNEKAAYRIFNYNNGASGARFAINGLDTTAGVDNVSNLGTASVRWKEVFAVAPAINTSDEREKTFLTIEDAERAAALEIKNNLRKFKFNFAIEEKGDAARIHFGVAAQQVGRILQSHNLDPHAYGFFCYDEWEDNEAVGVKAGNRYGVRYEELLCFIMAAI
jgi:hypothetical protein